MCKKTRKRILSILIAVVTLLTNLSLENLTVLANPSTIGSMTTENTGSLVSGDEVTIDPLDTFVPKVKEEGGELHYILEEDVEKREETSKHFVMEDGSGLAVMYAKPVHYIDTTTGQWKEIDNTLQYVEEADGTGYYQNTASDMRFQLAETVTDDWLVSISMGDDTLKWALDIGNASISSGTIQSGNVDFSEELITNVTFVPKEAASPNFVWRDVQTEETVGILSVNDTVNKPETASEVESYNQEMGAILHITSGGVYEEVLPGVDIEYQLDSKKLKENIILADNTASIERLGFVLTHEGYLVRLEEDGSLSIVDRDTQEVVYVMQSPFMTDNAGVYSNEISYVLEVMDQNHTRLSFEVDHEWLDAADRSWPVVIDPITTTDSFRNIDDTFVTSMRPNESHGNFGEFMVGYDSSVYGLARAYLRFRSFPELEPGNSIYDARADSRPLSATQPAISTSYCFNSVCR